MSVQTVDGVWTNLPCKVVKVGPIRARITAVFESMGTPIAKAVITINGKAFAKMHLTEGSKWFAVGPVELGDEF